ncbi:MAG: antibiotic biosynthesis monooxygenase [Lachnospiraceae bacterium]|nr:antibiotic biosynthesis monooxygenase [Lachnospiraceae bacterium]
MHQCISIITARPECVDTVINAASHLVTLSRSEKGLIYYNLLRSEEEPCVLILTEKWESKKDFLNHVAHAGEPGDPVYEFGQIAEASSAAPPRIINCTLLV